MFTNVFQQAVASTIAFKKYSNPDSVQPKLVFKTKNFKKNNPQFINDIENNPDIYKYNKDLSLITNIFSNINRINPDLLDRTEIIRIKDCSKVLIEYRRNITNNDDSLVGLIEIDDYFSNLKRIIIIKVSLVVVQILLLIIIFLCVNWKINKKRNYRRY